MKRVPGPSALPTFEDDAVRGHSQLVINGVMFYAFDSKEADTQRAKSEAIAEQAEELEMAKAELRAYRRAMGRMTPYAQVKAACEVVGIDDEDGERVIAAWRKIQELV